MIIQIKKNYWANLQNATDITIKKKESGVWVLEVFSPLGEKSDEPHVYPFESELLAKAAAIELNT